MEDYIEAHRYARSHMNELKKDQKAGCFYCLRIFHPGEIEHWLIHDNPVDRGGTALCPFCGVDSVIGESSGFPVTKEFLQKMHQHWFRKGEDQNS